MSTNKKNKVIRKFFGGGYKQHVGIICMLFSLLLCYVVETSNWAKIIILGAFISLLFIQINCSDKIAAILNTVWYLTAIPASLFLSQLLLNENLFDIDFVKILLGIICCGIVFTLLLIFTMNFRIAVIVGMALLMIFAAANYFVYIFRGSELAPMDFLSIGTALNVVGQYQFDLNAPFVYAICFTMIYCSAGLCIPKYKIVRDLRKIAVMGSIEIVFIVILIIGCKNISALHFRQTGSVMNGYFLNFVLQIEESIVQKPEGYNSETIKLYEGKFSNQINTSERNPDIIVIMNESFADLSILGNDLNTNIEVTPYFNSLNENIIRGHALSSVFGGGTPNSEYEFLSGNSMMFLPTGSIAYQQFIQGESHTILSTLHDSGYKCIATHPCDSKNWLRYKVYPYIGFDESHFLDEYTQDNLIREYVSDQEVYEKIISLYESKETGENIFLFGITMQNHGGYDYEGENYKTEVFLSGYSQEYKDVEQYLTLLHHSDQALQYLIEYFENVERDVIILFYGDHFPRINEEFYKEVHGGSFDTLNEQMLQYTVPFIIWTNYNIEEKEVECTSLNFLSNYLYETAGMELPAYNQFLNDVNEVIPAMNSFGYYSKEKGCFISYEDAAGEEKEVLEKYSYLQYNSLFDGENRSKIFFPGLE